jgi:hypothetical protein
MAGQLEIRGDIANIRHKRSFSFRLRIPVELVGLR